MNLRDEYKGKKVFISGITGFKGSWLALLLNELGAEVIGLGLENDNEESIYHQAKISDFAKVYITDVRDIQNEINKLAMVDMITSDYVFHLLAQPLVSVGYQQPVLTFDVNVMGTLIIQDILRLAEKPITFVNITTDKVYKPVDCPSKEEDVLQGEDPYSLSKTFSDMLTKMYRETFFKENGNVKSIVLRAGNVIGGGDFSKDRIVTDIVNSIENKTELQMRNPNSIRPYQFVLDCLIQYLYITSFGKENEYNVGPTNKTLITTENLVKEFKKQEPELNYNKTGNTIGKENPNLQLDTTRVQKEFNFIPYANSLDILVKVTLEWYKNKEKHKFSKKQIKEILEYYGKQIEKN